MFEWLEDIAGRCERELRVALAGVDLDHPAAEGFVNLVEKRVGELEVRVLASGPSQMSRKTARREVESWPRPLEVAGDEEETLRVLSASGAQAWAVESTVPGDVNRAIDRFDEAWTGADPA
jgi:hypothetical protein